MDTYVVGDIVRLKKRYHDSSLFFHLKNHGYAPSGLKVRFVSGNYLYFDTDHPHLTVSGMGSFYAAHFEPDTDYGKGVRNPALSAIEKKIKVMWERQPFFADYLKHTQKDRV